MPGFYWSDPLQDLDTSKKNNSYQTNALTYPLDLGSQGLNHWVSFYFNQSSNSQYKSNFSSTTQSDPKNPIATSLGKYQPDSTVNQNINSGADQNVILSQNTKRLASVVSLYMPPDITSIYSADWGPENLGFIGNGVGALQGSMNGTSSFIDTAKALVGDLGQSIGRNIANKADQLSGLNLTGATGLKLRAAFNPHAEVLFRGITFRTFQFQFKFTPRSEKEAIAVYNIVSLFKFSQAPEINSGVTGPYFVYPDVIDVKFFSNGKENDFINKISTCAMINLSVNYTGQGKFTAFRKGEMNGIPVETNISFNLLELELIHKGILSNGNY